MSATVDDEDYEYLSRHKWCASKGVRNKSWYAVRSIKINGKCQRVFMSRVIAQARLGEVVDHKNHDTLDNRRENLRVGTQALNQLNRVPLKGGSSRYKGVTFYPPAMKWVAHFKGHIGYFDNEEDAARAYNVKAKAAGNDWALLNVISGLTPEESVTMPASYRPRIRKNRFKGVRQRGRQWEASIQYKNQRMVIGYYPTALDAAIAFNSECDRLGCPQRKNPMETPSTGV
jgi:hypothetical protein